MKTRTTPSTLRRVATAAVLALLAAVMLVGNAPLARASALGFHLDDEGLLTISGSSGDDHIRISDTTEGEMFIDERASTADDWQRVTAYTGVQQLDVRTLRGNDWVEVRLSHLERGVYADLGSGNDTFRLSYALQGAANYGVESLVVKTGSGSDRFSSLRGYVRNSSRIVAGEGPFSISTQTSDWGGPTKFIKNGGGRFNLNGQGNDIYSDKLTIVGGDDADDLFIGPDTVIKGVAVFDMNGGDDEADVVQAEFESNLVFKADGGSDRLTVARSDLEKKLVFRGGGGDDDLIVDRGTVGTAVTFVGGGGDDTQSIQRSSVGARLTFDGGTGNDIVNLGFSTFDGPVQLDGGPDHDQAVGDGSVFNGSTSVENFEVN